MIVRDVEDRDCAGCLGIYNPYILGSTATAEITPLTLRQFTERVERIRSRFPFVVAEENGMVIGYAYLDWFIQREAFSRTADLAIYVERGRRGTGIGQALLDAITEKAQAGGFTTLVSVITDENEESLGFHAANGFVEAGHLSLVAEKFGRGFGVIYMRKTIGG